MFKTKPATLVISGLDPTGGAGITRDIITIHENGCHPLSLISALTVQNSMEFVNIVPVDPAYIEESINVLRKEFSISALKVGLLPCETNWISHFSEILDTFNCPIVLDPVLKATSDKSTAKSGIDYSTLIKGKNRIITPNLKELEKIFQSCFTKTGTAPQEEMAKKIAGKYGCSVVTTFEGKESRIHISSPELNESVKIEYIPTERPLHGTGCTFSSALTANIAIGKDLVQAVKNGADFITAKIRGRSLFNKNGQYFF